MANFQQEIEAKARADADAKKLEEAQAERAKKAEDFAYWEWLDRLVKNPDVQRLLAQFQRTVDTEREAALDTHRPAAEAEKARHRHDVAKEMAGWLALRHMQMKNTLFPDPKENP